MSWMLLTLQIGLSVMFLVAATGKTLRSATFLAALRMSHLPAALVRPLGIGILAVEYVLGFALLISTPLTLRIALGAAIALLAGFTGWMVWVLARQLHLDCGCFGVGNIQVGIHTVVRNSFLLFLTASAFVLAGQTSSPLPSSRWLVMAVGFLGLSVVLLRAFLEIRPRLGLTLGELST